jgi:ferritin-like metal-binding protein YciE
MANERLITWLNDAHAMEQGLIPILQNHARAASTDFPKAAARIEQHIIETRAHAQRLEQCLRELGTTPSTIKSTLSALIGTLESVATGVFADEQVKNAVGDYGAEQFEVGCYHALITAARQLGHERVAELCEMNMREDEAMAMWLRDNIPTVVMRALQLGV